MAIKTFTSGEVLTAADTNTYLANAGLIYVASTTFAGSAGVEMSNCFSSTYDNYKILITYYGSSASNTTWQMMTGTNTKDNGSVYYRFGYYWQNSIVSLNSGPNTSDFITNHGTTSSIFSAVEMTCFRPNVSGVRTTSFIQAYDPASSLVITTTETVATTTAYTGFYVFPAAGNITGTISVYGYRKP
tara:strand:+ start:4930 stop:5490 length:561 start_codon:yes stop_codon:yes gene_type:complete